MARIFFLVLLIFFTAFAAFGAPVITSIAPNTGWTFGDTRVQISGSGFTSGAYVRCETESCPVLVWFGNVTGHVISVTPETIDVYAPGEPAGSVDVRVERADAGGEVTLANGFHYSETANPGRINYTRYLVPVSGEVVLGAHGSRWVSELTMYNKDDAATLYPIGQFCSPILLAPCLPVLLAPLKTDRFRLYPLPEPGATGSFLYIPTPLAPLITKQLRVRDLSRSEKSLGAEVPIVPDDELATNIWFVDVPTDPNFRVSLRIYGPDERPQKAIVRVMPYSQSTAYAVLPVDLAGITNVAPPEFPLNPAYVRVDPITDAVRASGEEHVRIAVESVAQFPDEFSPPIWAFLTITNNETQEVTVISPQR